MYGLYKSHRKICTGNFGLSSKLWNGMCWSQNEYWIWHSELLSCLQGRWWYLQSRPLDIWVTTTKMDLQRLLTLSGYFWRSTWKVDYLLYVWVILLFAHFVTTPPPLSPFKTPALGHRSPVLIVSQSDNCLLSYQETQYGQQFWNSDTRTMKLELGSLNSHWYEHQSVR